MITSHGKCYTNYPDKEFNCSPKADKQFHCVRFWMTSREERTTVASFSPRNSPVEIKYTRPRVFSGELAELYQGLSQQQ